MSPNNIMLKITPFFFLGMVTVILLSFFQTTHGFQIHSTSTKTFARRADSLTQPYNSMTPLPRATFAPLRSSLGSGAVLEKPSTSTAKTTKKSAKGSAGDWEVRLYNDPVNKREHVAR